MKLRLWYGLRSALGFPRLTIPYAEHGWITVDERDYLQAQILTEGFYEREVWDVLTRFVEADEVVWDVGAHIGSFALRAMLDQRVREVHAFEPDPMQSEILSYNFRLNKGGTVHRMGLGNERGTRKLYRGPRANLGLSSFLENSLAAQLGHQVVEVECYRADDLVFSGNIIPPTLLKVDAEGWEFQVLLGARRILTESPPKAIVFESNSDKSGKIENPDLEAFVISGGYAVSRIDRLSGTIESRENFLAVQRQLQL